MKYIALDQNAWSLLCRAQTTLVEGASSSYEALSALSAFVEADAVRVVVVHPNIFETEKLHDARSRAARVRLMNTLSRGHFLVGPDLRKNVEIKRVLSRGLPCNYEPPSNEWFITNRFWEATSMNHFDLSQQIEQATDRDPEGMFYSFMIDRDDDFFIGALEKYQTNLQQLVWRIQDRRVATASESQSLRRKLYSVHLWMETEDEIWKAVDELGIATLAFKSSSDALKRDLVRDVPTLYVERELSLVLEAEHTTICLNDLMDMEFFKATIPYMDIVMSEKAFASRARQAKLDTKFQTEIATSFDEMLALLNAI